MLPYLSKLLEKIIHARITSYVHEAEILSKCQFGFQKNLSTYMPLLLLQERITKSFENGKLMCRIYLDLKKAFDTVEHSILLGKLEKYGFRNTALSIIESYLLNRQQCVDFNGVRSSLRNVSIGVPQGSILGPLLFLLYINDFPNISNNIKFLLYADDTAIFFEAECSNDLQSLINRESQIICQWLVANRLSLNTEKTVYQVYNNTNAEVNLSIKLDDVVIKEQSNVKYLGVYIDKNLKWSHHIEHLSIIISRNIGIINRSKYLLNTQSLLLLYNALVLPYINYCCLVWGFTYPSYMRKLEILQKRVVRIIDNQHRFAHSDPIFQKLKLLKVQDIARQQLIIVMFRSLKQTLPAELCNLFTLADTPHIPLRNRRDFVEMFTEKLYRTRTPSWIGPRIWNSIITPQFDAEKKTEMTKGQIKTICKNHFLETYAGTEA